jgi:hypothetical protein
MASGGTKIHTVEQLLWCITRGVIYVTA